MTSQPTHLDARFESTGRTGPSLNPNPGIFINVKAFVLSYHIPLIIRTGERRIRITALRGWTLGRGWRGARRAGTWGMRRTWRSGSRRTTSARRAGASAGARRWMR
jgi:hypothetical protein